MPLPGLRRVDHIGVTVPDLDEAHRFFVDVLGCEYLYSLGPFPAFDDDDWMTRHLNVHPRAVMVENRWFRCGGQAIFEVFHYTSPDQRDAMPRNSDIGGHHVAFYVDDLDAAVAHLKERGVRVLDGPTRSRGPAEGNRWIYFLSPWGLQFELVSYPGGKAWDRAQAGGAR
jgi:catechol 2,3-dioxygenase-like lactoylglutathione lyase family enzyme